MLVFVVLCTGKRQPGAGRLQRFNADPGAAEGATGKCQPAGRLQGPVLQVRAVG